MSYNPFNAAKPDAATDSIAQVTTETRSNFVALRDHLVTFGSMPGWAGQAQNSDGSTPPADATKPEQWLYSRGTERIRVSMTYGTSGGATDNVVSAVFEYSNDSGSTWAPIADTDYPLGKLTINYDNDSNVIGYSWS